MSVARLAPRPRHKRTAPPAPVPDHLRQFPHDDAAGLISGLLRILAGQIDHALSLEMAAFAKSRTLRDCMFIERRLRHVYRQREVAAMILASIPDDLRVLVRKEDI